MEKIDKILMPKDYIRYRLTDILATDFMDAHGTMIFNVQDRVWSVKICEAVGIPMHILPEVLPATLVVGLRQAKGGLLFRSAGGNPRPRRNDGSGL